MLLVPTNEPMVNAIVSAMPEPAVGLHLKRVEEVHETERHELMSSLPDGVLSAVLKWRPAIETNCDVD